MTIKLQVAKSFSIATLKKSTMMIKILSLLKVCMMNHQGRM
jgi:hypothetical protein